MTSQTNLEKLQRLLQDMFQFDCADLDFGIYRIMNYKRDVIERFITHDLPEAISEELSRGALADQSQAARELKETADQIRETLGKEALDADGNLAEKFHETEIGRKYQALKEKAAGGRGREALETLIYNHLLTFFGRYYQDGDFVSKRRYSKKQKYAIPYNGEEVYLHWANHDQYYVKTAEHFHDYSFTARGVTVHFKLASASVEQDNVKGDKRFFLPRYGDMAWDAKAKEILVPFEYRPLTEQEQVTYGKKNQQDKIVAEAVEEIPKRLKKADKGLVAVTAERHTSADGEPVTFLEHHLRQYTRRNTSDFFIHKDLKGFLSRELDFYLKNEVLNLDEMEAAGEGRTEGWFQVMRVIKAIGGRIVEFLAQIEDFQKMLWEKRKFVTETNYCITVQNVPEEFYPQIAACEAQWAEWKDLFHVDEEEDNLFNSNAKGKKDKRVSFLEAHPTLVLDTKHFDRDFVDHLLASFDDLDGMTDGLLVNSENFQALNLLLEKYREKVKCIYIDPPYNTGNDEFLYRDAYQHSSWLAMMVDRLRLAVEAMQKDAVFWLSIDDNEIAEARMLCDRMVFGPSGFLGEIVWKTGTENNPSQIAVEHEYVLGYARDPQELSHWQVPSEKAALIQTRYNALRKKNRGNVEQIQSDLRQWMKGHEDELGGVMHFNCVDEQGVYSPQNPANPHPGGYVYEVLHPVTGKRCAMPTNGFRFPEATFRKMLKRGDIEFGKDESVIPKPKKRLQVAREVLRSVYYEDNRKSINGLDALFGRRVFENPKSPTLLGKLFRFVAEDGDWVLDHFAGTGTTGESVIRLQRSGFGTRGFILVEMGDYFDTVLLPRIKKVTFSPDWKDGKPKRMATDEEAKRSPRIVKYLRLESYEDALNNIAFTLPKGQETLEFDDYLLKYVLRWETKESETLLNVEKLAKPFTYTLHIAAGQETQKKTVDIPETFNYLLGLNVRTRKVFHDGDRRYLVYRGQIDHRDVVVIWRETEGWGKKDLERDKEFVAEQGLAEGADEVFVNGDSFIPEAKALEPVFKNRMFSAVEV
ncbi:MAG: site-specific DNA-methyltransferase [bacterium]